MCSSASAWPSGLPSGQACVASVSPLALLATKRGVVCSASAWPRTVSSRSSPPSANSENLMLDEPAFSTAMASRITPPPCFGSSRLRLGEQCRHRARGQSRGHRVGAAGQDDRHARTEHDARGIGVGHEAQALGQHVAGLQVGHHQDVGLPGDRRRDLLDPGRAQVDGVVQRQRPVEHAAGDLAALGHLAQRRGLDRRRHLRIDGLHRRQDRHLGLFPTQRARQVDRVLHDVHLVLAASGRCSPPHR